jgi:hypothetical protein
VTRTFTREIDWCSLSSILLLQKPKTRAVGGLSRDERASEIASERMRARGERSVRARFPRLVSKINFRKNLRIDFGFFLLCEFLTVCTQN